jgi:hypothetical protein
MRLPRPRNSVELFRVFPIARKVSSVMNTLAQLVQTALATSARVAPISLRCLPAPSSRVWTASVINRLPNGCHVRVGGTHDVFVPAGYVPEGVESLRVRIQPDGLAVLPAA